MLCSLKIRYLVMKRKSYEPQLPLKIPIIPTSVSPPVVHDDYGRVRENNNDNSVETVKQTLL